MVNNIYWIWENFSEVNADCVAGSETRTRQEQTEGIGGKDRFTKLMLGMCVGRL